MQIEIPRAEQVHGFAKECGAAGSLRAAIPGVTIEAIVSENAVVAGRALAPLEIAVKQFRLTAASSGDVAAFSAASAPA